ncbi:MAG: hypothetical protein Q9187_008604 [Circinaria calcarea]
MPPKKLIRRHRHYRSKKPDAFIPSRNEGPSLSKMSLNPQYNADLLDLEVFSHNAASFGEEALSADALNGLQGKKKRADLTIADESSTLASIVTSNLRDIAKGQHQTFIRTLLQKVTAKALDASTPPSSSGEDTFVPTLHYPEYERHVVQEYADVYFEEFEKYVE